MLKARLGLTLSTLNVVNVLRSFARGHQGIHSTDAELTVAKMTGKGTSGVGDGEQSEIHQHEVDEFEVGFYVRPF